MTPPSQKLMKLVPVRVEWTVSPSTPFLRLLATESSSDQPTQVTFGAYFGLEGLADEGPVAWPVRYRQAERVDPPYNSQIKPAAIGGPYQLLKVIFSSGLWVRMSPAVSEAEVLNPDLYDFSNIPCRYTPGQGVDKWLKDFRSEWVRTRFCPNPRMYEVQESNWVLEVGALEQGFKHYVILGHDAYVEVLAKDWNWKSEGALTG